MAQGVGRVWEGGVWPSVERAAARSVDEPAEHRSVEALERSGGRVDCAVHRWQQLRRYGGAGARRGSGSGGSSGGGSGGGGGLREGGGEECGALEEVCERECEDCVPEVRWMDAVVVQLL